MSNTEIRPVPAGRFGVAAGDRTTLRDGEMNWDSAVGRAVKIIMKGGLVEIDGPIKRVGQSYWASSAGKIIVTRAVHETKGAHIVKISQPGFEEPIEERGHRRYHVAVGGSIPGVNAVTARITDLADKVEGTTPPTTLYERYFVQKIRTINRLTRSRT